MSNLFSAADDTLSAMRSIASAASSGVSMVVLPVASDTKLEDAAVRL